MWGDQVRVKPATSSGRQAETTRVDPRGPREFRDLGGKRREGRSAFRGDDDGGVRLDQSQPESVERQKSPELNA